MYNEELQSSNMQFGYKEGHSTALYSLIYKEAISYYLDSEKKSIHTSWRAIEGRRTNCIQ